MDKLDTAIANEASELSALGNIQTNYAALQSEIAALKASGANDPRLQQLLDAQAKVQAAEAALSAAVTPAPSTNPIVG